MVEGREARVRLFSSAPSYVDGEPLLYGGLTTSAASPFEIDMTCICRSSSCTARRIMACVLMTSISAALAADASAQNFLGQPESDLVGEGWRGFADIEFLWNSLLTLILATVLGAVVAYHPRSLRTVDTIEDVEAPKIYLTYAVIGAIIGVMVLQFGVVVGFVVFGIGGLIRFRTDIGSATQTGRLIFVTLIGLSCGLNLPHLAVLATAFGFGLIFILDARMTVRIDVRGLEEETVPEAADVYIRVLTEHGCKVLTAKRNVAKGDVTIIFRAPHKLTRDVLEQVFEREVPRSVRRLIDWQLS